MSPRGLSQGLRFLAPVPASRRLVTAPWTEEPPVRHYMPSNTGLACQKLNKPPSPQTEVPGAERAEPPERAFREVAWLRRQQRSTQTALDLAGPCLSPLPHAEVSPAQSPVVLGLLLLHAAPHRVSLQAQHS